jgi:hypothetical protein
MSRRSGNWSAGTCWTNRPTTLSWCLPDGRWAVEGRWWNPPGSAAAAEAVDWGRSGPNEMITLNALRILRAAGRLC